MPTPAAAPPEPPRALPTKPDDPAASPLDKLYWRVREALAALPFYFETETLVRGLNATDIFTLNSALGAAIEQQVVTTLNKMRSVWDPSEHYRDYGFVRQSQTFPDVLLKRRALATPSEDPPLLGIELKGWYLLAKEGVPSFRYKVSPAVCAPGDLLVIVPWALSDVISGPPTVTEPFIESARYAAEMRNYWWKHVRNTTASREIQLSSISTPYPTKSDNINDTPAKDGGDNFGRFARVTDGQGVRLIADFLERALSQPLAGISVEDWRRFFASFKDREMTNEAREAVEKLRTVTDNLPPERAEAVREVASLLSDILGS